jgi:bacterioferritin-associated ferredoxin
VLICHCKAVNDQTIRAAVLAGANDIDTLAGMCGAGSRCGGCLPAVIDLLDRVHDSEPMPVGTPAG